MKTKWLPDGWQTNLVVCLLVPISILWAQFSGLNPYKLLLSMVIAGVVTPLAVAYSIWTLFKIKDARQVAFVVLLAAPNVYCLAILVGTFLIRK